LNAPPVTPYRPLVSIVTPSLNAAPFIERTIESVLAQDYPHIEYTVMDGGSTDGTVEILERYRGRLQFVVEPDAGTADAVNRGFLRSKGAVFSWLSADDVYLPGAVRFAVSRFAAEPDAGVVYGQGHWIDESDAVLGRYPTRIPYHPAMFQKECCVCQPACFIGSEAFANSGMLDTALQSAFDYDLWIRLALGGIRFSGFPEYLASSRMHRMNKSLGARRLMFEENLLLLRRHYGYVPVNWVYGYLTYLRDNRDQFFQPLRRSVLTWLATLPAGARYNRGHLLRYVKEWVDTTVNGVRNRPDRFGGVVNTK
jgi:glycosyltransferase involved in cell wall biosynthesis